jgi:hypothetical protein
MTQSELLPKGISSSNELDWYLIFGQIFGQIPCRCFDCFLLSDIPPARRPDAMGEVKINRY